VALQKTKFDFKIKEEDSSIDDSASGVLKFHNVQSQDTGPVSAVKKPLLTLKKDRTQVEVKRKKFKNQNYFNVKNHIDLFETGKYFTHLIEEEGKKSFAFYGNPGLTSVHHTVLGLSSFFNFHKNFKVVLFIEKFEGSELQKFLKPTHSEMELIDAESEESVEYFSCDGVDIVEYCKLRHLAHKIGAEAFSDYLNSWIKRESLVLWTLPQSADLDRDRTFYLPIINAIDSVSLVVDSGKSNRKDLVNMYEFMSKYQIHVEGAVFYKSN